MSKRLELTVSDEMWDRLDVVRGHEPRASFVKRALAGALDGFDGLGQPSGDVPGGSASRVAPAPRPVPQRASAPDLPAQRPPHSRALGKGFVPPRPKSKK